MLLDSQAVEWVALDGFIQEHIPRYLLAMILFFGVLFVVGTSRASAQGVWDGAPAAWTDYAATAKRVVRVETTAQLVQAIKQLAPGDLVVLADGTYSGNEPLTIFNVQATIESPIVIAAENRGKAVLTGTLHFDISYSSYITIDGLTFRTRPAGPKGEIGAITLRNTRHARVTRNHFALREIWGANPSVMLDWVVIRGRGSEHNRIDHNLFQDKLQRGRFIIVGLLGESDYMPTHTRIDHNHFTFMAPLCINGMEAVVLGGGHPKSAHFMAEMDAFTVFEYNLMERVDRECAEIISLKSSGNVIRYNTIVESTGRIYFRAGNRNSVYGNYFIGNGKAGSGGVLVYGEDQTVAHNYFFRLGAPALLLGDGTAEFFDPSTELAPFTQVQRAEISFNTFIDNEVALARHRRENAPLTAKDVTLANNLIYSSLGGDTVDPDLLASPDATWRGNLFYAPGGTLHKTVEELAMTLDQVRLADPGLIEIEVGDTSVYIIDEGGPAVDAALAPFGEIHTDIEGRQRDARPDVGAFELVGNRDIRGPLRPKDVGPYSELDT